MIDFGVELFLILTGSGGAAQQESPLVMLMPMVVIGLIFYFLLIRPSMRKRKKNNDINAACAATHETNVQIKKEVHQEQTDIEKRLLRLDSLLHSGLITEEEHKVKREKIIDEL